MCCSQLIFCSLSVGIWSSLSEAIRGGHFHVVQYLIDKGLDIDFRTHDGDGGSPLWWAKRIHGKDHKIVKFLETKGARDIAPDPDKK
jgi:prolyl 4-hydroxylase